MELAKWNSIFFSALVASLLISCNPAVGQLGDETSVLRRDGYGNKNKKGPCEQVNFLSKTDFDLETFIQRTWFIQKQQINPYQSEDDLFCVTATYDLRPDNRVQVMNAGRVGSVTGDQRPGEMAAQLFQLCAEQVFGGRLRVGPCLLGFASSLVYGPYWVLAVGVDEVAHDYSWAIISGGAPDVFIERKWGVNFCTTTNSTSFLDVNGSGLWLFTRERVAPKETIEEMEGVLKSMGIYAGGLKEVKQEGCAYPSWIKL